MTNNLHNIVVFIKDEAMLQEAREILERYGQECTEELGGFYVMEDEPQANYIQMHSHKEWYLSVKVFEKDTEITLPELEQLLKQNRDER